MVRVSAELSSRNNGTRDEKVIPKSHLSNDGGEKVIELKDPHIYPEDFAKKSKKGLSAPSTPTPRATPPSVTTVGATVSAARVATVTAYVAMGSTVPGSSPQIKHQTTSVHRRCTRHIPTDNHPKWCAWNHCCPLTPHPRSKNHGRKRKEKA